MINEVFDINVIKISGRQACAAGLDVMDEPLLPGGSVRVQRRAEFAAPAITDLPDSIYVSV